jgi:hypothetical protein
MPCSLRRQQIVNLWSTSALASPVDSWRAALTSSRLSRWLASTGALGRHGKEGVSGSSPSEGSAKTPHVGCKPGLSGEGGQGFGTPQAIPVQTLAAEIQTGVHTHQRDLLGSRLRDVRSLGEALPHHIRKTRSGTRIRAEHENARKPTHPNKDTPTGLDVASRPGGSDTSSVRLGVLVAVCYLRALAVRMATPPT